MSDDWRELLPADHRWKHSTRKKCPMELEFWLLHMIDNLLKHGVKLADIAKRTPKRFPVDMATLQRFVSGERGLSLEAFIRLISVMNIHLIQQCHELDSFYEFKGIQDLTTGSREEVDAERARRKDELRVRNKRLRRHEHSPNRFG